MGVYYIGHVQRLKQPINKGHKRHWRSIREKHSWESNQRWLGAPGCSNERLCFLMVCAVLGTLCAAVTGCFDLLAGMQSDASSY